ncbi:MAG: hypothetical protein JW927_13575 [Deltaproteobacteria bacterium]|nr:hypothetical protein [Deltaproteobacteria bacterium]
MIEKKHPNFNRKMNYVIISGILLSGLFFSNILGFIKPQIIPMTVGILLGGIIIFSTIIYCIWISNHVACPKCSGKCKRYSDSPNKSRKVVCPKCRIIWDLGVSFNLDS